jgi:hypothetical protein
MAISMCRAARPPIALLEPSAPEWSSVGRHTATFARDYRSEFLGLLGLRIQRRGPAPSIMCAGRLLFAFQSHAVSSTITAQ